jgi:hypothetical protein
VSTWIKLHDNFATNLKVLAAGEDAAWLYVCGLLYCSANLTDGVIPTPALRTLTAKKDARTLARILVREGLWVETSQGWEVHEYLAVQRSKAQIMAQRDAARTRKAKSRTGHTVTPTVTDTEVRVPETDTETDNPTPTPPPPEVVTSGVRCWHGQTCSGTGPDCDPAEADNYAVVANAGGSIVALPKPSIDPCQVEALRRAREKTFGLPDRTAASSSTPVSPIHPPQAQPEGRSE